MGMLSITTRASGGLYLAPDFGTIMGDDACDLSSENRALCIVPTGYGIPERVSLSITTSFINPQN